MNNRSKRTVFVWNFYFNSNKKLTTLVRYNRVFLYVERMIFFVTLIVHNARLSYEQTI